MKPINIASGATGSSLPVLRRGRGCHAYVLVSMLLALAAQPLRAAEVIPPRPTGTYINDYANVLSRSTIAELNRKLQDFESQTSNQVLVVIYPKMQTDSDIADYAVRVSQAWGVGRRDRKNGVILFIFTQDRKMTIQVGYGLEGAMPDAISKRIIEDEIKPPFQRGDYNSGVRAGVDAIMKATKGEYKGTGRTLGRAGRAAWVGPVIVMIGIWIFAAWLRRQVRSAVYGGRGAYRRRGFGGGFWPGYYIGSGGGWSSGGGGSWGGGGGGGGGGGFSAGGGSFGGGGASGSW